MKTLYIFLGLSALSLIVMILVDIILGSRAEFLSAFSVVQRMIGQTPSAGESQVAQKIGAFGEFVVVLVVNLTIGAILTVLVRFFTVK